jgi:hypothetical protein
VKLGEIKTNVKLRVGDGFSRFVLMFLFVVMLESLPQIGLQLVLDYLGEVEQETG